MERKTFYVSVKAMTILENQGDAAYELDIVATPEEVEQLYLLFESHADVDDASYITAHIPAIPYHHDNVNDVYDRDLKEIYQILYNLGTKETKNHILSMKVLNE